MKLIMSSNEERNYGTVQTCDIFNRRISTLKRNVVQTGTHQRVTEMNEYTNGIPLRLVTSSLIAKLTIVASLSCRNTSPNILACLHDAFRIHEKCMFENLWCVCSIERVCSRIMYSITRRRTKNFAQHVSTVGHRGRVSKTSRNSVTNPRSSS